MLPTKAEGLPRRRAQAEEREGAAAASLLFPYCVYSIVSCRRCDFAPIYEHLMAEREKKKALSKEARAAPLLLLLLPPSCRVLPSCFVACVVGLQHV